MNRKIDHLQLTAQSQYKINPSFSVQDHSLEKFYYEPMLGSHISLTSVIPQNSLNFLQKKMLHPLWISSMTGGTKEAGTINRRLAEACAEFGLGMGLGSCRSLLTKNSRWSDFLMRPYLKSSPFLGNIGIAQLEQSLQEKKISAIIKVFEKLAVDGIMVHVNPLQELAQMEGDRLQQTPLKTLTAFKKLTDLPILVKEVGQGMGPQSLKCLLELGVYGIELAGLGGTNFTQLELLRAQPKRGSFRRDASLKSYLIDIGHSAEEMVAYLNKISETTSLLKHKFFIISGGRGNPVQDAKLYLSWKDQQASAVIGLGQALLGPARRGSRALHKYIKEYLEVFYTCCSFLQPSNIKIEHMMGDSHE